VDSSAQRASRVSARHFRRSKTAFQRLVLHALPLYASYSNHHGYSILVKQSERRPSPITPAPPSISWQGYTPGLYLVSQARAVAALALNIERHRRRTEEHHEVVLSSPASISPARLCGARRRTGNNKRLFSGPIMTSRRADLGFFKNSASISRPPISINLPTKAIATRPHSTTVIPCNGILRRHGAYFTQYTGPHDRIDPTKITGGMITPVSPSPATP